MRAWGIATGLTYVLPARGDDGGNTQPIDAPSSDADAVIDAAPNADAYTGAARTLFLNRNGGTYTAGPNDSVANRQDFANMTVSAPAYPFGDAEWTATKDCVTALFAPFRVNVVD